MSSGLNIKVKKSGRVRAANLDNGSLTAIGNKMVAAQLARWASGVNANGNPAKRLSMKYLFEKKKYTGASRPIRDMKMTGATIRNFGLRKANDGVIRAENSTRLERAKAQRAQNAEPMIGFAGTDQIAVFDQTLKEFGDWARRAWVPLG